MNMGSILYKLLIAAITIFTFLFAITHTYVDAAHNDPQKAVIDAVLYSILSMTIGFILGYEGYKYWRDKYLNAEEKIYTCITETLKDLDKIRKMTYPQNQCNKDDIFSKVVRIERRLVDCYTEI